MCGNIYFSSCAEALNNSLVFWGGEMAIHVKINSCENKYILQYVPLFPDERACPVERMVFQQLTQPGLSNDSLKG